MKFLNATLIAIALFSTSAYADTYVRGYYRKNGTYVQPHYRSDSNGSKFDNWSTRGNVNHYTGKVGTKDPYGSGSSYKRNSNSYNDSYSNSWNNN